MGRFAPSVSNGARMKVRWHSGVLSCAKPLDRCRDGTDEKGMLGVCQARDSLRPLWIPARVLFTASHHHAEDGEAGRGIGVLVKHGPHVLLA